MTLNATINGAPVQIEVPAVELRAALLRDSELRNSFKRVSPLDLAEILDVSVDTINRWTRSGKIPSLRIGGMVRYNLFEVETVLQKTQ